MRLRNLIMMMLDEIASCRYEGIWICTEEEDSPVYVIWGLDKDYKEKAMDYLRVFGQRRVIKVVEHSVDNEHITYEGYRVLVESRCSYDA